MQGAKLADLEDRGRCSNLVLLGVPGSSNETEAELRKKELEELFFGKMNVPCTSVARIHRLGRKRANRPIILFLRDYNEKADMFRNAKRLKGTKVFIQNDYCQNTLFKRKMLWESGKPDKEAGCRVALINDKLRVNDDFFIWDETSHSPLCLLLQLRLPFLQHPRHTSAIGVIIQNDKRHFPLRNSSAS